jgi:catechol 2,3-dioxygenase-like lactoylglutathione lyase family enzyme
MDSPQAAGVVFVDDVLGVSAFYRAVTGMEVLHAGDGYAVLGSDGFQLTVHALPVPGGDGSGTYPTRHDTYIKLCFPVPSLAQARATAAEFGGELWPAEKGGKRAASVPATGAIRKGMCSSCGSRRNRRPAGNASTCARRR